MGSERLPGKVLERLGENTVLGHLIDRMKTVQRFDDLVVAIPDTELDNPLADYVLSREVGLFRGSEGDVLDRYLAAAREFEADQVVRLSGEDPFRDPRIVASVLEHHLNSGADLTTNWVPRTYPVGMEVEVFKIEALEKLAEKSTRSDCREGVSRMAYFVPGFLRVKNVSASEEFHWPDL
jgi:spore coat polysaccharide biosynthesis protein SpsF